MKSYKTSLLPLCAMLLLGSCTTPKQIAYFQDLDQQSGDMPFLAQSEIRIRPKDKVSIIVNTQDQQLTNMFNLPYVSQQIGQESYLSGTSRGLSGYTVDSDGMINFPVIGKIRIEGMTREEVAEYISNELKSNDLVKDPVVTVEFMNLSVNVLGEVNSPGKFDITKDNMTILDALSQAGDLTIYGRRDKVLVLREESGKQKAYEVNLCSGNDIFSSPVYYLQQNDVVYVEPNDTRGRQSTVNGNNVRSTSFWISFASLLTSIAVLIFK